MVVVADPAVYYNRPQSRQKKTLKNYTGISHCYNLLGGQKNTILPLETFLMGHSVGNLKAHSHFFGCKPFIGYQKTSRHNNKVGISWGKRGAFSGMLLWINQSHWDFFKWTSKSFHPFFSGINELSRLFMYKEEVKTGLLFLAIKMHMHFFHLPVLEEDL